MAIGALTAGGTFFVLMLTDFRGIQELGFIAGTSILLAWLSMMTLFPAVLVLVDGVIATALSIWALPSVAFDYNLLNLQADGTESVVWERRVLENTGRSGFNALASAATLDE